MDEVRAQITRDLADIEYYGSTKLYLCWYDEFLVAKAHDYPCCNSRVQLIDVINIIREVCKKQYIIRHNVLVSPFPASIKEQYSPEEYCVEVCLVYGQKTCPFDQKTDLCES